MDRHINRSLPCLRIRTSIFILHIIGGTIDSLLSYPLRLSTWCKVLCKCESSCINVCCCTVCCCSTLFSPLFWFPLSWGFCCTPYRSIWSYHSSNSCGNSHRMLHRATGLVVRRLFHCRAQPRYVDYSLTLSLRSRHYSIWPDNVWAFRHMLKSTNVVTVKYIVINGTKSNDLCYGWPWG